MLAATALVALASAGVLVPRAFAAEPAATQAREHSDREVHVYKSPTCGCCGKWIDHLRANGFRVRATDVHDVRPIKRQNGVPGNLSSCHTAIVDGYVIEGHVPASDVKRLLEERPSVAGLAVPDMPIGSPGMEGRNPERYDVMSFGGSDGTAVFATHGP